MMTDPFLGTAGSLCLYSLWELATVFNPDKLTMHVITIMVRGDIKISRSRMTKTCWGNIGNLFVICL